MAGPPRQRHSLPDRHTDLNSPALGYPRRRRSRDLHLRLDHPRTLPLPRPPSPATPLALRLRKLPLQRRSVGPRRDDRLRPDPHHPIAPDTHLRRIPDLPRDRRTLLGQSPPPRRPTPIDTPNPASHPLKPSVSSASSA